MALHDDVGQGWRSHYNNGSADQSSAMNSRRSRRGSSSHCTRQRGSRLFIYLVLSALFANANLLTASSDEYSARPYAGDDLFADTWVATDGAGRQAPGFAECGKIKPDKWVGIFYWTWHTRGRAGPNDNTKLLGQAGNGPVQWPPSGDYHWGEPELGYYVMTDPFVIRKRASMLADAGIDVVIFDTTNLSTSPADTNRARAGR